MFRTARRIAPLLRSLLLGAAMTSTVAIAGGAIAGCSDEADPATHVKRLSDRATRPAAVNRLIQFFEDKMTQDKGDRNGPNVKPLLETIVQPMAETCVAGDLDERTTTKLIKFLADTYDPKAEPCILKTLKDYKPEGTEEDVRSASRYVKMTKLKSASAPIMDVFKKIHASKPKGSTAYRDVHDAMIAIADPTWEKELTGYLDHAVDQKDQAKLTDEMFWQITSAELLGHMKAANAVKPLIKMLLSPPKVAGQTDSILALVKIGKPAIGPAAALLKGEDKDLVDYSKGEVLRAAAGDKNAEKAAGSAHIGAAALILATIGREEAVAPLLEALSKSDDNVAKAIMARELTKVPKSPQTMKAFQETFEKLPIALSIPNSRGGAREVLYDSAANFFDSSFVPWMLDTVKKMKGDESDLAPIREAALAAMLKVVTKEQLKILDDLAGMKNGTETVGKSFEKEIKLVKEVLNACGDNPDCYAAKLAEIDSNTDGKQLQGIKSAYMIGVIGNPAARAKIMASMPKISHPAVRFASVSVLDALSPKGDAALAGELQKIVDEAVEKKDQTKMKLNQPFKTVIYRLNARAQ